MSSHTLMRCLPAALAASCSCLFSLTVFPSSWLPVRPTNQEQNLELERQRFKTEEDWDYDFIDDRRRGRIYWDSFRDMYFELDYNYPTHVVSQL